MVVHSYPLEKKNIVCWLVFSTRKKKKTSSHFLCVNFLSVVLKMKFLKKYRRGMCWAGRSGMRRRRQQLHGSGKKENDCIVYSSDCGGFHVTSTHARKLCRMEKQTSISVSFFLSHFLRVFCLFHFFSNKKSCAS